jgi:hypothetical protein
MKVLLMEVYSYLNGTDKFEDRKRTLWKIKKEYEDEHLSVNGIEISFTYFDNILEWAKIEDGF